MKKSEIIKQKTVERENLVNKADKLLSDISIIVKDFSTELRAFRPSELEYIGLRGFYKNYNYESACVCGNELIIGCTDSNWDDLSYVINLDWIDNPNLLPNAIALGKVKKKRELSEKKATNQAKIDEAERELYKKLKEKFE